MKTGKTAVILTYPGIGDIVWPCNGHGWCIDWRHRRGGRCCWRHRRRNWCSNFDSIRCRCLGRRHDCSAQETRRPHCMGPNWCRRHSQYREQRLRRNINRLYGDWMQWNLRTICGPTIDDFQRQSAHGMIDSIIEKVIETFHRITELVSLSLAFGDMNIGQNIL